MKVLGRSNDSNYGSIEEEIQYVKVMHYNSDTEKWEDATIEVDPSNNIAYANVTHFSIFTVMRLDYISATIDLKPETFFMFSHRKWVTIYIEFPEELKFDVNQINIETILLSGNLGADPSHFVIGDYDYDGIPDLMVKFDSKAIQDLCLNLLSLATIISVEVSGTLYDGVEFKGCDTIRII